MLRYAGVAAIFALIAGVVAWLSDSNIVSFFAMLAMHLALVLGVALVVMSVGSSSRDPSGPPR